MTAPDEPGGSWLTPAPAGGGSAVRDRWFPALAFVVVAGAVVALSVLAHARLPLLHRGHRALRTHGWLDTFGWWDGWWYVGIARRGYFAFGRHVQTPAAFFPAFPLLMRLVSPAVGGPLAAGFALSLAFGLAAAVAFHRWSVLKIGPARARLAVALLLVYPFAFYLMGAVYADSLFLCAAALLSWPSKVTMRWRQAWLRRWPRRRVRSASRSCSGCGSWPWSAGP